jgi:hypothetical protein
MALSAAEVEWRAVLSMGGSSSYSLSNGDGSERAWVEKGGTFLGYAVVGTQEDGKVLVLSKGGKETRLTLEDAKIGEGAAGQSEMLAQAEELMRSMKFNELIAQMVEQQKNTMRDMTRQMSGQFDGRKPTPEQEALQAKVQDIMMAEIFGPDFASDVAKIYAKVLSPNELKGLTNFYATEAGQGFIAKQGDLMKETMAVMQPRMVGAMQKVRKVIVESGAIPPPPAVPPPPPPGK